MKNSLLNIVAVMLFLSMAVVGNVIAQDDNSQNYEVKIKTSAYSEMCKNRIETEIKQQDGVVDAYLDLKDQTVIVTYKSKTIKSSKLKDLISDMGYDAEIIEDKAINKSTGSTSQANIK
ncbi:MAG: heavy metal-associated domain-containing protein [Candidatus Kapabacteria bacterium]|nr:heavy metal-associated domain-containing protein [Candidatus Kapabacteria bacterium]